MWIRCKEEDIRLHLAGDKNAIGVRERLKYSELNARWTIKAQRSIFPVRTKELSC